MADQHEQELARELVRRGYTRRQILKIGLSLGLSTTGISTLLTACGGQVTPQTAEGEAAVGEEPTSEVQFQEEEGAAGPWPQTAVPEPSSQVEISVAHAWDASFWPRQQQFDRLFMERHPNIKVNAENTPWGEFLTKYLAQAAAGSLPDLIYVHFSWAQQLIQQGSIIELDDYIAQQTDFDIDDFTEPSLVSYRRDGKIYGIPYDEGPGILFYNKKIFDDAGVDYPPDDWTLEDLKQAAIQLTSGEGPSKIFGYSGTPSPADSAMAPAYLFPFGARYLSEDESECQINQQTAIDAMEWWMELRFEHGAVPSPADLQTMQGDPFQFGRVAMMLNGSWATPGINQNANFEWDVAMWPRGPEAHSTFSAGSCYAITKDSQQRDAAWIYLNEYISTTGQIYMWGSTGRGSPSRNSAWPSYLESEFSPPNAEIIQESLNTIASHDILDQPTAARVTQTAGPIWDLVINEQLSIQEALDRICTEIEPIIAENRA